MPEWHHLDSSTSMSEQQESAKKKTLKSSSRLFWFSTGLRKRNEFVQNPQKTQRSSQPESQLDHIVFAVLSIVLYIPFDNFSVMSGQFPVYLWLSRTKQIKYLAQGHNTVWKVEWKPLNPQSNAQPTDPLGSTYNSMPSFKSDII